MGGGTLTPVTPGIGSIVSGTLQTMPLTLDAFSRIMGYDPCQFMGIKTLNDCHPLTCSSRNRIVSAAVTAVGLIENRLNSFGRSLYDEVETRSSKVPYFLLDNCLLNTLTVKEYAGAVTIVPGANPCNDIATISVAIDALDACESFYGVYLDFGDIRCKRLGIEYIGSPTLVGNLLQIRTYAYNLIDLDTIGDTPVPADSIPYISGITAKVYTVEASVPKAVWAPTGCSCYTHTLVNCVDPCCVYTRTDGCLIERRNGVYDFGGFVRTCSCCVDPEKYEIDVMHKGVWVDAWSDAVVSLMNSRIPSDYCECDTLVNQRFRDDNGISPRFERVYPYSYNNPFGILTPGAQYAWRTIETVISNTEVIKF